MALRIVVAGEIYLDQVLAGFAAWPQPGEEVFAATLTREVGGGAPHTAAGLARLGWDVTLIGPVGNDPWLRTRLEQTGLPTDGLRVHASEATGTTVAISMPGERTFFTYRGANKDIDAALRSVGEADHLHIAAACGSDLLRWLCTRAKTVSVDAGWHPEWLRDEKVQESLRAVSWFLPNELEAAALTGEKAPEAMLQRFHELGIRAVVKLGPAGSAVLAGDRCLQVPSINVEPADTTGAGDCFNAGFLDAWLRDEPLHACLASGNICGALSTRNMGGVEGFPTREEVNEWRSKSL
jgi:sugar/nucleoside kinase (ribokinase family)